jgi:hypothetical protein
MNGGPNFRREVDVCGNRDALFAVSRSVAEDVYQSNSRSNHGRTRGRLREGVLDGVRGRIGEVVSTHI